MSQNSNHEPELDRLIEEAVRAWDEEHGTVTGHLDAETLISYQEGSLPDAEADAVRRLIVANDAHLEDLQALHAFDAEPDLPSVDDSDDESKLEAGWVAFDAARREQRNHRKTSLRRDSWRLSTLLPLAASLIFATLGLSSFLMTPGLPEGPPLVFDLTPDGVRVERAASQTPTITVPERVEVLVPRLRLGDQTPYDRFDLVLRTEGGSEVARLDDAVRDAQGRFALSVARSDAPSGSYHLELTGFTADGGTLLASYSFIVRDGE